MVDNTYSCDCSQVVETLCNSGCDTSLRNADGHTGWEVAESLDRVEIVALDRNELDATAKTARDRRLQELTGGTKSPSMTIKTKGTGLLQHESY